MKILRYLPILAAPFLILLSGCDRQGGEGGGASSGEEKASVQAFGDSIRELQSWAKAKETEFNGSVDFAKSRALLSEMVEKMKTVDTSKVPQDLADAYRTSIDKAQAVSSFLNRIENEQEMAQRMIADPSFAGELQKVADAMNAAFADLDRVATSYGLEDLKLGPTN